MEMQENGKGINSSSMDDRAKRNDSDNDDQKTTNSLKMWRSISTSSTCEMTLRFLAMALTLVAAVVAGVDKETKIIDFSVATGLPPLHVPVTAKWHYMSSTVYLVVANAIACTYSVLSLLLHLVSRSSRKITAMPLLISDLMMVALLFSASGAAAAVGLIAVNGNSHTHWIKICNMFKKYCRYGATSIIISMLGSTVFLCLVVLAALRLHKKSLRKN